MQEGNMDAVKLEGGEPRIKTILAILHAGIPVMGHLGLTPQSIHVLGGYHPQGRNADTGKRILEDALALEEAGCFAIVLESIPARLAEWITQHLKIPTIGIGAGPGCDGQVLVVNDVLGMYDRFTPKFVKKYRDLHQEMLGAFKEYIAEVLLGEFPARQHTVEMTQEEWDEFQLKSKKDKIHN
jgi:3-methyl-2-oxobutanoate hydroxymethyltransferase